MKKTTFKLKKQLFILLNLMFLGISIQSIAQNINTTTAITWPFNSGAANQSPTYTTGTENYFKPASVALGTNYVYGGTVTPTAGALTADPTLTGVVFTAIKNPAASGNTPSGADIGNLLAFNVTPVTGLAFKPTSISFKCQRYGTGTGVIDLYWKSNDGTVISTLLQSGIKPARDGVTTGGDYNNYTINLTSLTLPSSTKECTLQIYVHSLGFGKSVGISNVVINGTVNGNITTVTSYNLTTTNAPQLGGSVVNSPIGTTHDAGTSITLTANKNFGYSFSHWENESGQQISTTNPYTFTLNSNANIKAVYNSINTYSLSLTQTAGSDYMVVPTPPGTIIGGQRMYENGTDVTIKASNNSIFNFSNWGTGETNPELTVKMDQNKTVNAAYSTTDYIAAWDFYKTGNAGRVADFASKPDNSAASLVLRKADATTSAWLGKSVIEGGNYNRGSAVNWKLIDDKYYYQISFNATDFANMSVKAGMLYNFIAYSVQNVEYSLDGTNFTSIGTYTLSSPQTWYDLTFPLPAAANNAPVVYVRWIPDYTSVRVGSGTTNDGTSISEIYIFGSEAIVNDGIAPVLVSSIPANTAINASSSGKIVLNFDEKVQIASGTTATLGTKILTPEVSGKTISFPYTALDYNTNYTFTLTGAKVSDLSGNTLTAPISFTFTTLNKPTVIKKKYDFIVGVDGNFAAAKAAAQAASSSGKRFFIFFPNGQYDLGNTTGDATQKTTIGIPNVSYIGQSADDVILYNQPLVANEGIGTTPTINFLSSSTNIYMQDITVLNKMDYRTGSFTGRAVAIHDQGNMNIYKNVKMLSNQDTFYTGGNRIYLENSEIHGTVDFIFGGGDVFFNDCTLYLENRPGNVITAAATTTNWGYVFNNCTIDGISSNNGNYRLGRPWNNEPKVVYINTKMNLLPTTDAWGDPMNVVPFRFAEYNSTTSSGGTVDLSNRRTSYTKDATTVVLNPVLTEIQAANYTIDNVLGGNDAWQPKLYTDQITAPAVTSNGTSLNWDDNNYVLGWAILKDGIFVDFVTTNSYTIPNGITTGKYTIKAANSMGGLGSASNVVDLTSLGVKENQIQSISVYPNPVTNDTFYVSIPTQEENTTMALYGLDGKQLLTKKVKSTVEEVNVSTIPSGVYLLKINTSNNTKTFKIIK